MSKHLKTLRDSALIDEERPVEDARVRSIGLRPERLNELSDWLSDVDAFWNDQLASFKAAADAAAKRPANEPTKARRDRRTRKENAMTTRPSWYPSKSPPTRNSRSRYSRRDR